MTELAILHLSPILQCFPTMALFTEDFSPNVVPSATKHSLPTYKITNIVYHILHKNHCHIATFA